MPKRAGSTCGLGRAVAEPIAGRRVGALTLRPASPADADWIAALHTDSWQRNYRGSYSDRFLDERLAADHLALWHGRLAAPTTAARTLIAERDDEAVGFVHVELDDDAHFGALVDNLHVRHDARRSGIGRVLLAEVARLVATERPGSGYYLWVLEANNAAIAFYRALGGTFIDRGALSPPGGDPENLCGRPTKQRVVWPAA